MSQDAAGEPWKGSGAIPGVMINIFEVLLLILGSLGTACLLSIPFLLNIP